MALVIVGHQSQAARGRLAPGDQHRPIAAPPPLRAAMDAASHQEHQDGRSAHGSGHIQARRHHLQRQARHGDGRSGWEEGLAAHRQVLHPERRHGRSHLRWRGRQRAPVLALPERSESHVPPSPPEKRPAWPRCSGEGRRGPRTAGPLSSQAARSNFRPVALQKKARAPSTCK
jgi:hypothetical protein